MGLQGLPGSLHLGQKRVGYRRLGMNEMLIEVNYRGILSVMYCWEDIRVLTCAVRWHAVGVVVKVFGDLIRIVFKSISTLSETSLNGALGVYGTIRRLPCRT